MQQSMALGKRICVIGYSGSGKSTLSCALAKSKSIPVYHLDLLAHKSHTNWQRLSDEELISKHGDIVTQPAWIIEGNYHLCMQQRFKHADTVICLRLNRFFCAYRYLRRSWRKDSTRPGKLPGAKVEFRWWLLKHILFIQPSNQLKYIAMLKGYKNINVIKIKSFKQLQICTKTWCA